MKRSTGIRATLLDMRMAGTYVSVVVGPVAEVTDDELLNRLQHMTSGGPEYRIGILPSSSKRQWAYQIPDEGWVHTGTGADTHDVAASALEALEWRETAPVVAARGRDHLTIRFDHGIGDAFVMYSVIGALCALDGRSPVFEESQRWAWSPLSRTVMKSVLVGRRQYLEAVRSTIGAAFRRGRRPGPVGPGGDTDRLPEMRSTVVFARSGDQLWTELREAAGRHAAATPSALLCYRLSSALRQHLPAIDDQLKVIVNMRRYLPKGESFYGNMNAAATLAASSDQDEFVAGYVVAVRDNTTPGRLAASVVKARITTAISNPGKQRAISTDNTITLVVSDISRGDMSEVIHYVDSGSVPRTFCVALPLSRPNQMSLLIARVGAEVQVTATFDAGLVDADAVRAALAHALRDSQPDAAVTEVRTTEGIGE